MIKYLAGIISKMENKERLPMKFYVYKVLCEYCYYKDGTSDRYYKWLHRILGLGYNLYGKPTKHRTP